MARNLEDDRETGVLGTVQGTICMRLMNIMSNSLGLYALANVGYLMSSCYQLFRSNDEYYTSLSRVHVGTSYSAVNDVT